MQFRRHLTLLLALAALLATATAASAQTLPANAGDFAIQIDLAGAPTGSPSCDPDLTTIGVALTAGQSSVSTSCTMTGSATQKTATGTASNASLAASTGDAGFNSGTINALCDSTQTSTFAMNVSTSGPTLTSFGGTAWFACAFTLTFADAQASTLTGTIETNATLGKGDGSQSGNTINVTINGQVYVTGGTGYFAGQTGSGTFDQQQSITIPTAGGASGATSSAIPDAACTALGLSAGCTSTQVQAACVAQPTNPICASFAGRKLQLRIAPRAAASTMQLKLKPGAGSARILVPAPPAGKPRAAAKVKATTKVKMTATVGAQCTVKASTGAVVGTKTASGKYGAISIRPKAGAYAGATWIKATCTKSGKSFASNKVRISLK